MILSLVALGGILSAIGVGYWLYSGAFISFSIAQKKTRGHHMIYQEIINDLSVLKMVLSRVNMKLMAIPVMTNGAIVKVDWKKSGAIRNRETVIQAGYTVNQSDLELIHDQYPELGYQKVPASTVLVYTHPVRTKLSMGLAFKKFIKRLNRLQNKDCEFYVIFQEKKLHFILEQ